MEIAPQYQRPMTEGGPEVDTGGIVWVNRGTTDNFGVYGAQAAAARNVVDAAFFFWNRVITNLNQDGGNSQLDVTLTATARGSGVGGGGGVSTLLGNKPRTGAVTIGGGIDADGNGTVGDAEGFYLDPAPYDFSEFKGGIINAFTGNATPGSAAVNGFDMFSLVAAEIQHALGITSTGGNGIAWRQDPNDYLRLTTADDNTDTPGDLWVFKSPTVKVLLTSNNGGPGGASRDVAVHSADPANSLVYEGDTYTGVIDTGGATYQPARRNLPSYNAARMLGDIYGYTINPPQDSGQCFYAVPDPASGSIHVRNPSLVSSDRMEMRATSGGVFITLDIGDDVAGTNMDGPFVCQFPRAPYNGVLMEGGGGNDFLRTDGNDGVSVTMRGGNGDDFLDLSFIQRNLDLITGAVVIEGGNNFDRIFIYDNNDTTGDTFTFGDIAGGGTFDVSGTFNSMTYSGCEEINPTTGTGGDTLQLFATPAGCKMHINSVGGAEVVNVGMGVAGPGAQLVRGDVHIENTPNFTTLNINDTGNSVPRTLGSNGYTFGTGNTFAHVSGVAVGTVFYKLADVNNINVIAGSGSDVFLIADTPRAINYHNTGGADVVRVGNAVNGTDTILQNVNVSSGGFVIPTVIVDNAAGAAHTNTTLGVSGGTMNVNGMTGGGIVTCPTTSAVQLFGSSGNDIITLNNTINNGQILVDAGGGSDVVNVVGARVTTLTVRGGTDAANDFLDIFDATMPTNVVGGTVFADRIVRDTAVPLDVFYSGFSSVNWNQQNQQNAIVVRGISADIAPNFQFAIIGNSVDDFLEVHTQDAAGNPTILGNLSFSGNGGPDAIQVFAGPTAESFRFYDAFGGGSTAYLGSNGPRWIAIAAGVETIQVHGGAQNDSFAVEKYAQGGSLSLFGGGGNDTCTIGNGDLSADLTSASAFTFDGQTGTSDTFVISNIATTTSWDYRLSTGSAIAQRVSTAYSWTTGLQGVEKQIVNAGSARDSFVLDSTAAGVQSEFNGFAGNDGLLLGLTGNTVNNILGPVVYNGGQDGGNMGVYDSADTSGDVVHLDANTLGAYAGDTLFGPGGSLTFADVVNFGGFPAIFIDLGSGADVVYAQPHVNGRITINANNPTSAPGDVLNLATAGLVSPVINGTAASGSLNSSNRQTLDWTGFEGSITTDNVAPAFAVANINVIGIPAGGGQLKQTVDVGFFENVGGLINVNSVQFTNLTTGQVIPASNAAVQYSTFSNTASFSFPGYPNGVLPDGNYTGRVFAGLPDFFGNPLPADATFSFYFLNADANRDRSVNLDDFTILAANFGQVGRFFTQGDFNYDVSGAVNLDDFTILASQFGKTLLAAGELPRRGGGVAREDDVASFAARVGRASASEMPHSGVTASILSAEGDNAFVRLFSAIPL